MQVPLRYSTHNHSYFTHNTGYLYTENKVTCNTGYLYHRNNTRYSILDNLHQHENEAAKSVITF